jgi:predicted secreted hydrolase
MTERARLCISIVVGLAAWLIAGSRWVDAQSIADGPVAAASAPLASLTYPYHMGRLSFPRDEGKHPATQWPMTLIEWHAFYAHLSGDDGTRYLLFTTFVTYDPIEPLLEGKFPHLISTLIDVNAQKTYRHRSMAKLKKYAEGHAEMESQKGDYFRWKGMDKPFQYALHVAWKDSQVDYCADLDLSAIKPPLAVNGTGYIKLPKGDSGYYSQTRLQATGELTINGERKKVSGVQWLDRQWLGASFVPDLASRQYSYEWWALHLDNNEEAILFRIWDLKSQTVAMSLLEINRSDGTREHVDPFTLTDQPTGWHLVARNPGWDLTIKRVFPGQRLWQTCDISGTIRGKSVTGLAVAELVRDGAKTISEVVSGHRDTYPHD